jgi:hypothetical protein
MYFQQCPFMKYTSHTKHERKMNSRDTMSNNPNTKSGMVGYGMTKNDHSNAKEKGGSKLKN